MGVEEILLCFYFFVLLEIKSVRFFGLFVRERIRMCFFKDGNEGCFFVWSSLERILFFYIGLDVVIVSRRI